MSRVTVYHGTQKGFRPDIEANGIRAADPRAGVRLRTSWAEAVKDAKAVCAFYFLEDAREPVGLIAVASVDRSRLWLRKMIPRIAELRPDEIEIKSPINFPEFLPETGEVASATVKIHSVKRAAAAIDEAYNDFMQLRADGAAFNPARRV